MISVIVPIYNTEQSLKKCVDSVLASSYEDFELILVNDGSTDNSLAICAEYCRNDGRVRLIDQANQGASVARNKGLESSRGEWVVFLDSDDSLFPNFLKLVAQEHTADLLIFDFSLTGLSAEALTKRAAGCTWSSIPLEREQDKADLIERLLRFWPLEPEGHTDLRAPWAKAFRKSVLDTARVRFTQGVRVGEDALFNMEVILAAHSCKYLPVPVYWHRVRMDSISHRLVPGFLESFSLLQRAMRELLEVHGMIPLLEQAYAANTLENMAFMLIKGVFHPDSENSARENRALCRQMREDEIYREALRYNYRIGILPRRILLGFFHLRCYGIVRIICRVCFFFLHRIDQKQERQSTD